MQIGGWSVRKSGSEQGIVEDQDINVQRTRVSEFPQRQRKAIILDSKHGTEHFALPGAGRLYCCGRLSYYGLGLEAAH